MTLAFSIILALIPLAGVAFTAMNGALTTVDGLFMSLILLTLSGILFLNAFLEVRNHFKPRTSPAEKAD